MERLISDKLPGEGAVCPICEQAIETQDQVIRVMDQPVHMECFRQQSESWTAA